MARIVQSTAFPQVIPSAVPRVCGDARKSPSSQGISAILAVRRGESVLRMGRWSVREALRHSRIRP